MDSGFKYRLKQKQFVFHSDPGHGWLAVKMNDLKFFGIESKISEYSYMKGDTVYLEEDCDAGMFFDEYFKMFGKKPAYRESYLDVTPIRYYPHYTAA